jgi:hypothetical protein
VYTVLLVTKDYPEGDTRVNIQRIKNAWRMAVSLRLGNLSKFVTVCYIVTVARNTSNPHTQYGHRQPPFMSHLSFYNSTFNNVAGDQFNITLITFPIVNITVHPPSGPAPKSSAPSRFMVAAWRLRRMFKR